jgi:hypothetical protein
MHFLIGCWRVVLVANGALLGMAVAATVARAGNMDMLYLVPWRQLPANRIL